MKLACVAVAIVSLACAKPSPASSQPAPPEADAQIAPAAAVSASILSPPAADAAPSVVPFDAAVEASAHVPTATLALGTRFQIDYPTRVLRAVNVGQGVLLKTSVFERYMDHTYPFEIELRVVGRGVVDEVRRASYGTPIFATADESSFLEQPGFADRITTAAGLPGYLVSMGVEGVGQIHTYLPISPRESIHVTCRYCCGLLASPTLTRDEQVQVCAEVLRSLRSRAPGDAGASR